MSRYLEFKENSDKTISVWNKKTNDFLGLIHYYYSWKQYVFQSHDIPLVFNDECLTDISNKLRGLKK